MSENTRKYCHLIMIQLPYSEVEKLASKKQLIILSKHDLGFTLLYYKLANIESHNVDKYSERLHKMLLSKNDGSLCVVLCAPPLM